MSVASDEGTFGWTGQQLVGDLLLKGVFCLQKAGHPPPRHGGSRKRVLEEQGGEQSLPDF